MNLAQKILAAHLVEGKLEPGEEIAIRIDQTLTQDATGTATYLQFEAMGVPRVRTRFSVSYVDHQLMQADFKNADDHLYLQDVAAKYGIYYSRPGNGICHQVHLERFGVPGETLLGSDSHTPMCGALGMLALGAGGLDVATAMAGAPYYLRMPRILGVELVGELSPWVSAKDVIFELLRQLTVKGGVGWLLEYFGPGVASLSVTERATIANMGAELGATTSLFPSDEVTRRFLRAQQREQHFSPQSADPDSTYDRVIAVNLSALEPLIAQPGSPDAVVPIHAAAGTPVDQVAVGSCTNSSFQDLATIASVLRGRAIHPRVSMMVSPGSRQVYEMAARSGILTDLIASGARILESGCGPCAGMGGAPSTGGVSVRSFNRNFPGRSGTVDAGVYLASPAVCAAVALAGEIVDPRELGDPVAFEPPEAYVVDDRMVLPPPEDPATVVIRRGPNIQPIPTRPPLQEPLRGQVLIKLGDNISTDQIIQAGMETLPLRSNVPASAQYVFRRVDPTFVERAQQLGGGFILAGNNYGQGSSREIAALGPMYLGIKAVLARSFARIHAANLANFGIVPLTFLDPADYDAVDTGDDLEVVGIRESVAVVHNRTRRTTLRMRIDLAPRAHNAMLAGGLLTYIGSLATTETARA
ncbi:MAG: aconitate hydratase [Chloroflexi bacterium]|nr:aconitate hydratase [Chloroflexota bacterium]